MLSLGNSYSATFDYDFTNVNNRGFSDVNKICFFHQPIIASYPYYYLAGQKTTSGSFYLSQYNYVLNQETWVKIWGPTNVCSSPQCFIVSQDNSRLFMCGGINTNYDGQTNKGFSNIYLTRINATNGATEWSRIFGSTNSDFAPNIKLDLHTNLFIFGMTTGSIGDNTNKGGLDIFLTKYDYEGNYQWTKMWGSTNNDDSTDMAIDASNNVYLLGWASGDMVGGQTNKGLADMFLIKTDTNGITQWIKTIGSTSNDVAEALAIDCSNNIVIYGCTYGDLNGQSHTGLANIAILKYDSSGSNIWTKLLGSTNYYYQWDGGKIELYQNDIYVTSTMISNTAQNVTLIKFSDSGNNIWAKTWATGTNYKTFDMSMDASGSLFIVYRPDFPLFGNYEIKTLFHKYDLIINSSTNQHGTNSLPFNYGTNRVVGGIFTNSIADEYPSSGTRYTCTGWNGSGSIATNGLTNTVVFFLTNNSTLTWNWQKQYYVSVSNTIGCRVSYINGTNGWNNEGANIVMIADPQIYFQNWSIQPISAAPTNNPLYVINIGQPLSIIAYFGYEDNGYGIASEWVASYWGTSYNPTTSSDFNGDGLTDYECYLAGINPTVTSNYFAITSISMSNGFPVISWKNNYTQYGRYFTIMSKNELTSNNWSILGSVFATENGYYIDTNTNIHAFYKVVAGIK